MAVAGADTASTGPTPSLDEVRELARDYNLIPIRETLIDDVQTPVSAWGLELVSPRGWTLRHREALNAAELARLLKSLKC